MKNALTFRDGGERKRIGFSDSLFNVSTLPWRALLVWRAWPKKIKNAKRTQIEKCLNRYQTNMNEKNWKFSLKKRTQFYGWAYHKIAMAAPFKAAKANLTIIFYFLEFAAPAFAALGSKKPGGFRCCKPLQTFANHCKGLFRKKNI